MTNFAVTCLLLSSVFSVAQSSPTSTAEEAAIHDYVLTTAKIDHFVDAMKDFMSTAQKDPALAAELQKLDDDDDNNSLNKIKKVENSPRIMQYLRSHGETARDFILLPLTALTASMGAYGQEHGAKMPAFVNPANIKFVQEHKADIDKLNQLNPDAHSGDNNDQ